MERMRYIGLCMAVLLSFTNLPAQIHGTVSDSLSGRPLPYVNVYLENTPFGSQTDAAGQFFINKIPPGRYLLLFQRIGYAPLSMKIRIQDGPERRITVKLHESTLKSSTISVTGRRLFSPLAHPLSRHYAITDSVIMDAPGGFEDPLLTLKNYTGVISRNDYTSNFYVRGSPPEQQAFIMDGVLLQNPYRGRMMGYGGFTVLNPDIIDNMDLVLSGYSAAYGNRMGGLVNIRTRDGAPVWRQKLSLNLVAARYMLQGPLSSHLRLIVSLRRTYYDWLMQHLTSRLVSYPFFYDLYGKLTWIINPHHILRAVVMGGGESAEMTQFERFNGNFFSRSKSRLAYLTLTGYLNSAFNYQLTAAYQLNDDSLSTLISGNYANSTSSLIVNKQRYVTACLNWEKDDNTAISGGLQAMRIKQRANIRGDQFGSVFPEGAARQTTGLLSGFLEGQFQLFTGFKYRLGYRGEYSDLNKEFVHNPRTSLEWQFLPAWQLSAVWGVYHQFPDVLESFSKTPYTDQIPLSEPLPAHKSVYSAVGLAYRYQRRLTLRMELYEKFQSRLTMEFVSRVAPDEQTVQISNSGQVLSKGAELTMNYNSARWALRMGYVYSKTQMRSLERAQWKALYFDSRHWLNCNVQYKVNRRWSLNSALRAGSGFPTARIIGWSKVGDDAWALIPSDEVLRHPYFRWDWRVTYRMKKWNFYLEIINITDAHNFDQNINHFYQDGDNFVLESDELYMIPRLPVFGLSFTW